MRRDSGKDIFSKFDNEPYTPSVKALLSRGSSMNKLSNSRLEKDLKRRMNYRRNASNIMSNHYGGKSTSSLIKPQKRHNAYLSALE